MVEIWSTRTGIVPVKYRYSTGKPVLSSVLRRVRREPARAARSRAPISSRRTSTSGTLHQRHEVSRERCSRPLLACRLSPWQPTLCQPVLAPTPALSLSAKNENHWFRSDVMRADFKTTSNRERSALAPAAGRHAVSSLLALHNSMRACQTPCGRLLRDPPTSL